MRGADHQQSKMFSYLSPEQRVRADHPLRAIRVIADRALAQMSERFARLYAAGGAAVDRAGETVAGVAGAASVYGAQRAAADGRNSITACCFAGSSGSTPTNRCGM